MESRLGRLVVDALYPRYCVGCAREGTLWCASCAAVWWPSFVDKGCPFCGCETSTRTCFSCKADTYLDGLTAFGVYANPVIRAAIHQWKYVGDRGIEPVFQQWLIRAAPIFLPYARDAVFAPVPLHVRKRRARGFDQAGLMTDWFSHLFSIPAFDMLQRSRFTASQALRSHTTRQIGELDGVFSLHAHVNEVPKKVILCDDVFTSGATMDSAARVLKEAGVETVWGFVLAKGSIS